MPQDVFEWLNLVLRWGHILSAIFLMGGTFFMRVALLPAMAELPEKEREEMADRVRGPWATAVMTSRTAIEFFMVAVTRLSSSNLRTPRVSAGGYEWRPSS